MPSADRLYSVQSVAQTTVRVRRLSGANRPISPMIEPGPIGWSDSCSLSSPLWTNSISVATSPLCHSVSPALASRRVMCGSSHSPTGESALAFSIARTSLRISRTFLTLIGIIARYSATVGHEPPCNA